MRNIINRLAHFFSIILVAGIIYSCQHKNSKKDTKTFRNLDCWTFIGKVDSDKIEYAEIMFEDKQLRINSEANVPMGPFPYKQTKDYLTFNGNSMKIITNSDGSITLKNNSYNFALYKIPFSDDKLVRDQIDPFYLRRCYFLVHLGYETTDEAISYLSSIKLVDTTKSKIKEEVLFTNPPRSKKNKK